MMRLFVAATFSEINKKEITAITDRIRSVFTRVRFTDKDNLHLTLKFLGNINVSDGGRLEQIKEAVRRSIDGIKCFETEALGFGYFEREKRVIYLKLKMTEELVKIAGNLNRNLAIVGLPEEKKVFRPHVTLVRGKKTGGDETPSIMRELETGDLAITPFKISKIVLFNSKLRSEGPVYSAVAEFALNI